MKHFKKFNDNPENVNITEMWKALKKVCPKFKSNVPVAKKDFKGKLITEPKEIKKLLAKEYKQRLRNRPTRPDFYEIKNRKN